MTISRFALGAMLFTCIASPSLAQQASRPTIAALFSNDSNGMAFWIECRNTTGHPVESRTGNWIESYRVDGVEPHEGGRGGSGGSHPIPAGALWRGVFAIANAMTPPNAKTNSQGSDGGMVTWISLTPGHHTLAVQCVGAWSDDISFFWNP